MTLDLTPAFDPQTDICLWDPSGRAKIVWFIDFTCDRTRRIRDVLLHSAEVFGAKNASVAVRFARRKSDDKGAEMAARAAIAAHWQGKYRAMHAKLFAHRGVFDQASVIAMAKRIKLDLAEFKADLFSERTSEKLTQDAQSAAASGVDEWPCLYIDGARYTGVWDETSIIDAIERPLGVRLHLASQAFLNWAASAGFVLVAATLMALAVVNFGGAGLYLYLQHLPLGLTVGGWAFSLPLEIWINDGLMALFFLLVGIEIKRELVNGELSSRDKAAMPIIAAVGGMIVPAAIYAVFNFGQDTAHGWGVPMATDIAFTLGLMALLGPRVPTSLKVFVSALAIADDLGAILVIALFYGHGFHAEPFLIAAVIFGLMLLLNFGRIYARLPYLILFVALWAMVHESGLHATLAGVLTAAAIPSRRSAHVEAVAQHARNVIDKERDTPTAEISEHSFAQLRTALDRLREPGFHLQFALERWSNYVILPLFAFFNTGILIAGAGFSPMAPEVLGVTLGLVIGKPLGILLSVLIATKLGIGRLSSEITMRQLIGAAFLAGIGFTMSIFIGSAAFDGDQLQAVKLAILLASAAAAVIGVSVLAFSGKPQERKSTDPVRAHA